MKKIRQYVLQVVPAFLMVALYLFSPGIKSLGNIAVMAQLLIVFECVIYYLVVGFSNLYNPNIDFDGSTEYDRIVSAIIIGVHVMVSVVILGVYFAV